MQAVICSPCCSSHQESLVHLAYFSFPVNYFGHLDAIWGASKETRTRHNEQGAPAASWHRPGGGGAASIPDISPSLTFLWPPSFTPVTSTTPGAVCPPAQVTAQLLGATEVPSLVCGTRRLRSYAKP